MFFVARMPKLIGIISNFTKSRASPSLGKHLVQLDHFSLVRSLLVLLAFLQMNRSTFQSPNNTILTKNETTRGDLSKLNIGQMQLRFVGALLPFKRREINRSSPASARLHSAHLRRPNLPGLASIFFVAMVADPLEMQ